MRTITFYSYKGGSGRTLLVANAARYLARLGQRVVALDLDFEAPGLHYKFSRPAVQDAAPPERGVIDYVYERVVEERDPPPSLEPFSLSVPVESDRGGWLRVFPAGAAPSADYWRRLARINWYDLFYEGRADGVPLFLDLKARIQREFVPDFLLIDSRTGITEIGGVATSYLPDQVVCLVLTNPENVDGAREVLRSIGRVPRADGGRIEVVPVLTRLPDLSTAEEAEVVRDVRDRLNLPGPDVTDQLNIEDLYVLHSEPDLQVREAVRVGGKLGVGQSRLYRDYLRLFLRLIPKGVFAEQVTQLVAEGRELAWDDRNGAEELFQTLLDQWPREETLDALLRFYRLTSAPAESILAACERYATLTGGLDFPGLYETVQVAFAATQDVRRPMGEERQKFLTDLWRARGAADIEFGIRIAARLARDGRDREAAEVLTTLHANVGPQLDVVLPLLDLAEQSRGRRLTDAALTVAAQMETFHDTPRFLASWGRLLEGTADAARAAEWLTVADARREALLDAYPETWARLMRQAGRAREAVGALEERLGVVARQGGPSETLRDLVRALDAVGRPGRGQASLATLVGDERATDLLRATDTEYLERGRRVPPTRFSSARR